MASPLSQPVRARWSFVAALLVTAVLTAPAGALAPPTVLVRPDAWRAAGMDGPAATEAAQTVLIAGDIASCTSDGDEQTAALVEQLPGLVMTAGDNVYPSGTAAQFQDCYAPSWGRFLERTRPVTGNHDWMDAGATGYFGQFGLRAGPPGRGWYAFDLGGWRVYALVSDCWVVGGCGAGSRQLAWLKTDLAKHPRGCVLAVWHAPRFSSGPHGDSTAALPLLKALYRHGAELVVNGHDHVYERFAPARPNGVPDTGTGIRQFIVGTGGAPLYDFTTDREGHSEVRSRSSLGVLRLTLRVSGYAWEFLPVEGGTFRDSGRGSCH